MKVKHTNKQCHQALSGIKDLLERLHRMSSDDISTHVCDSAIDICNQLLREAKK